MPLFSFYYILSENWNDGQRSPTYQSLFGEESVLRDRGKFYFFFNFYLNFNFFLIYSINRADAVLPPIPGENEPPQQRNISVVIAGRQAATEQPPPYAQCPAWNIVHTNLIQPRMMPGQMYGAPFARHAEPRAAPGGIAAPFEHHMMPPPCCTWRNCCTF
jgi:hypothetical protein